MRPRRGRWSGIGGSRLFSALSSTISIAARSGFAAMCFIFVDGAARSGVRGLNDRLMFLDDVALAARHTEQRGEPSLQTPAQPSCVKTYPSRGSAARSVFVPWKGRSVRPEVASGELRKL